MRHLTIPGGLSKPIERVTRACVLVGPRPDRRRGSRSACPGVRSRSDNAANLTTREEVEERAYGMRRRCVLVMKGEEPGDAYTFSFGGR